jgi:hypothetical protein
VSATHVRPPIEPLTDADARHLLADGLLRLCHKHGPSRVALKSGCDEKTAKGVMIVPLMAGGNDVIPAAGAAIHRIGQNRAQSSQGGHLETDEELIASEAENDALLVAVLERRSQISRAKLRRAA